jgi:hypothetical protein
MQSIMVWMRSALCAAGALIGVAIGSATVHAQCRLCSGAPVAAKPKTAMRPLHIDIETTLDFSIAAHMHRSAGSIEVDSHSGARRISGGLVGLGGSALRGTVTLTGEPFARVNVTMPRTIKLVSTRGDKADVSDLRTTLSLDPALDGDGRLVFSFGGRLSVDEAATGNFHGQVHISAEYQ